MGEKPKLTPEQLDDARRLKKIWDEKRPMSQEAFGDKYDLGSQGNVTQYLNGHIPLNLEAAIKFAYGLKVEVSDFSPSIAATVAMLGSRADPLLHQLVQLYKDLSPDGKDTLLGNANRIHAQEHPGPSVSDPFPTKPTKSKENPKKLLERWSKND